MPRDYGDDEDAYYSRRQRGPREPSPDDYYRPRDQRRSDRDDRDDRAGLRDASLEHEDSFRREVMHLEPPPFDAGPRSVPPHSALVSHRPRDRSRSSLSSGSFSDDGTRSRSRGGRSPSPLSRARNVVEDTFTNSATGLGAGILGAFVGGFVAREASSAALKHRAKGRDHSRRYSDDNRPQVVSTILGAVAGGLGANALANRVEDSKAREKKLEHAWEKHCGSDDHLPRYNDGRRDDFNRRDSRHPRNYDNYDNDNDNGVYDDGRYDDYSRRYRGEEDYGHRR